MNPHKRSVFEASLCKGKTQVFLSKDALVELPETAFDKNGFVCLEYGDNLPVPIMDLTVNQRGIRATLSFSREPFKTFVPWESVFAMVVPSEGFVAQWMVKSSASDTTTKPERSNSRPKLSVVH